MAEYKTEEEQIESLKHWWEKNGKFAIVGVIIVIAGAVGGKVWRDFQITTAGKVSAQYDLMLKELDSGDVDTAAQRGAEIIDKNPDMYYAILAALALAKAHVEKAENDQAIQRLSWAMSHNNDVHLQHIIRIRLAKVLLSQDKLDEAMTHAGIAETGAFGSQYEIVKGDIFYKKGEFESAKTAYQAALNDAKLTGQLRNFVQLKLDDLASSGSEEAL